MPNVENLSVFMAQPSGVVGTKDAVLHTRPYRHTTSMFPYSALDAEDSEAEDTPSWLPARTTRVCLLSVVYVYYYCVCVCSERAIILYRSIVIVGLGFSAQKYHPTVPSEQPKTLPTLKKKI